MRVVRSKSMYGSVLVQRARPVGSEACILKAASPPSTKGRRRRDAYVNLVERLPGDYKDGSEAPFCLSNFLFTYDEEG